MNEVLLVCFGCSECFGNGDVECLGLCVEELGGDHVEVAFCFVLHHDEEVLDYVAFLLGFVECESAVFSA